MNSNTQLGHDVSEVLADMDITEETGTSMTTKARAQHLMN